LAQEDAACLTRPAEVHELTHGEVRLLAIHPNADAIAAPPEWRADHRKEHAAFQQIEALIARERPRVTRQGAGLRRARICLASRWRRHCRCFLALQRAQALARKLGIEGAAKARDVGLENRGARAVLGGGPRVGSLIPRDRRRSRCGW